MGDGRGARFRARLPGEPSPAGEKRKARVLAPPAIEGGAGGAVARGLRNLAAVLATCQRP